MKTRVITAVIALSVFIPLIIVGSWPLMLAAIVLGMVAMSELLLMKKMFLISFEAIVSYLGVAAMIVPQTWLDFLPEQIGRLTLIYVMVALLLLHTVIRKQRFNFDDAGILTLGMLYIGMGFNAFTVSPERQSQQNLGRVRLRDGSGDRHFGRLLDLLPGWLRQLSGQDRLDPAFVDPRSVRRPGRIGPQTVLWGQRFR